MDYARLSASRTLVTPSKAQDSIRFIKTVVIVEQECVKAVGTRIKHGSKFARRRKHCLVSAIYGIAEHYI